MGKQMLNSGIILSLALLFVTGWNDSLHPLQIFLVSSCEMHLRLSERYASEMVHLQV